MWDGYGFWMDLYFLLNSALENLIVNINIDLYVSIYSMSDCIGYLYTWILILISESHYKLMQTEVSKSVL